jgi:hypothetical protein
MFHTENEFGIDFRKCTISESCSTVSCDDICIGGRIIRNQESNPDADNVARNKIYRFKFTEEFMQQLYAFSKIHQYDDKNTFKESWKNFALEQEEMIFQEMRRLSQLGYHGDVLDKMYKSARYYFRKKSTAKKEPKERRKYISFDAKILEAMDKHIADNMENNEYQPKNGFSQFCKQNEGIIRECMAKLYNDGLTESKSIEEKLKKTYKNRYFMITRK